MESKLLQNMQQTYQNVEYWISVGKKMINTLKELNDLLKNMKLNCILLIMILNLKLII